MLSPNRANRRTPHSASRFAAVTVSGMKMKQKDKFTLSSLRTATYQVWGGALGEKMVQWAINSGLVALPGLPEVLKSTPEGRSS